MLGGQDLSTVAVVYASPDVVVGNVWLIVVVVTRPGLLLVDERLRYTL